MKLNIKNILSLKNIFIVLTTTAITVLSINIISLKKEIIFLKKEKTCVYITYNELAKFTEEVVNFKFETIQKIVVTESNINKRNLNQFFADYKERDKKFNDINNTIAGLNSKISNLYLEIDTLKSKLKEAQKI